MKNLQCDICSKQVQSKFQLENLREVYQTENIAQICEVCGSVVDKQLYKIQTKSYNDNFPVGDVEKELEKCIVSLKECVLNLQLLDDKIKADKIKAEGFWSKVWNKIFG